MSRLLIAVLLSLTASSALAQSSVKPAKLQPHINRDARFRSLDSTNPINLADYRDKVVVVVLWASWCIPCREVFYRLADLQKEFAEEGVQVIALSNEDPQKAYAEVRIVVAGLPPAYRVGWISTIAADQLMTRKELLPHILVVRDGVILKTFVGWHSTKTVPQLRLVLDEVRKREQ